MEALKFTAKPVERRIMIELPLDMDVDFVEVIVRPAVKPSRAKGAWRKPPKQLRSTVIHDDLIAPAVSEREWDALR